MRYPAAVPEMQLVDIDGVELEVHDHGSGEPVVFFHVFRDEWYAALAEPALRDRYRLVYHHRRGYGNSSDKGVPLTVADQAADCRALMAKLGIERAHVAALSGGGTMQLQFALDFPDAVQSLAVLEPLLPAITEQFSRQSSEWADVQAAAMALFEEGKVAEGGDTMFRYLGNADYRERCDQHLPPGWFERILADWDRALQHDFVAFNSWQFTSDDAARISAPVLNLKGADSTALHQEYHKALQSWIPHAESAVLPDTGHFMPETNPKATAERLAEFFSRHPVRS